MELKFFVENHGQHSEWVLHELASHHLIRDFIFPNPFYYKGNQKRELADMIVVVEDTLLVFQIKSHISRPDSPHNIDRLSRKMAEGFRQFRVLVEATKGLKNATLKNRHGIEVPFSLDFFSSIFLVCVIHVIQDESEKPIHVRTLGENSEDLPIFTVGLEANDLFFLVHQCDTVPDFTNYIATMLYLEKQAPVSKSFSYLDLLAFIRLYPDELMALIEANIAPKHLNTDSTNELLLRGSEFEFPESYLVDAIIARIHELVDLSPELNPPDALPIPISHRESYWIIANKLAVLTRESRQTLASMIIAKRHKAHAAGYGYATMIQNGCAYTVHSSSSSPRHVAKELAGVCLATLATNEVANLCVGLAFLPGEDMVETFVAAYYDRNWGPQLDALKEKVQAQGLFEPAQEITPEIR